MRKSINTSERFLFCLCCLLYLCVLLPIPSVHVVKLGLFFTTSFQVRSWFALKNWNTPSRVVNQQQQGLRGRFGIGLKNPTPILASTLASVHLRDM